MTEQTTSPSWREALSLERRMDRAWDRAAQRTHDRLVADPTSFSRPPAAAAAVLFALAVITGFAATEGAALWLAITHDLWWRWPLVIITLVVAWVLADPRGRRLREGVISLSEDEYPGLHEFVRELAAAMQAPPPRTILADLTFNAAVASWGTGRRGLIIGLPAWAVWQPGERIAVLGHELGHLRGRDTGRGRVLGLSLGMLGRAHYLLKPAYATSSDVGGGLLEFATYLLQEILAAPFALLHFVQFELLCAVSQHQEYAADRRAIALTGPMPLQTALARIDDGLVTELDAAVRRGEDPFAWLQSRPAMSAAELASRRRYLEAHPTWYY